MSRVSNRLSNIDRRIEEADTFVNSARRGEKNAKEKARQDKERKKRQKAKERTRIIQANRAKKSHTSPRVQRSTSSSSACGIRMSSSSAGS